MGNIPNLITLLNLAAGFLALILASAGNITTASWIIAAAMILDFLDGFAARMLRAYSDFGKELDSLSDMVSFGVAPALVMYRVIESSVSDAMPGITQNFGIAASLVVFSTILMPVCAALRLARFNIDPSQSKSFRGLPTPASALAVISLVIAAHYSPTSLAASITDSPPALAFYTVIFSLLMVIRIPMISLKISKLAFKGNEGRYILALLVIVAFVIFGISSAIMIVPLYIVVSLVSRLF